MKDRVRLMCKNVPKESLKLLNELLDGSLNPNQLRVRKHRELKANNKVMHDKIHIALTMYQLNQTLEL